MTLRPDYYKILGVAPKAEQDEVKKAFRKLAMRLHPDVDPSPGATERFIQLNEAYEILSDPRKRSHYDRSLIPRPTGSASMPRQDQQAYRDWVAQAQRRAEAYSRMNYQQFQKNRFDHAQEQVYHYLQYLVLGLMFLMAAFILVLPIGLLVIFDWKALLALVGTIPLAVRLFGIATEGLHELRQDA